MAHMPYRQDEAEIIRDGKMTVLEKFERDLRAAGAERWEEAHCDFVCLPDQAVEQRVISIVHHGERIQSQDVDFLPGRPPPKKQGAVSLVIGAFSKRKV